MSSLSLIDGLDKGVTIGSKKVSILMYTDDIVLLRANEIAMQDVIKCSNQWLMSLHVVDNHLNFLLNINILVCFIQNLWT